MFMDSSDGEPSSARRPIVLARIPHVGAQVGAVAGSAPVAHAAPAAILESQPSTFSQGTRFYVDQQHALAAPTEPEFHEQLQPQAEPQAESQSRQRRFHGAHGRRQSPEASSESRPAGSPQPGVANGLSRLHGEVTSYSGLIVTLVLAASGALLYWMIVVPGRVPVADYKNSYETFGSVEIESPEFPPRTAPPAEHRLALTTEQSAPPETTADAAAELLRLPEQLPLPSDEPPPVFDDASAQDYPTTDHPQEWNLARTNDPYVSAENSRGSSAKPEMAHREMPPTPIPVSRQQ